MSIAETDLNTQKIKKILGVAYAVSFTLALIAALAVSTWSLMDLSVTYFHVPKVLGWVVSGILDVGAIGAALLSTIKALDGESGGKAKFSVFVLIAVSAWLNGQHAHMAGFGWVAIVLFAVPSIGAGLLLELFLDWLKSGAMREKGRVHREFPLVRNLATVASTPKKWLSFYRRGLAIDLELANRQLQERLGSTTVATERADKPQQVARQQTTPVAALKTPQAIATAAVADDFSMFEGLSREAKHSELVSAALDNGATRDQIQKGIEDYTGKPINRSTLNTYCQRWNKKRLNTGMYL